MKLRKLFAGVAATAVAASAAAVCASAELIIKDSIPGANGLSVFISSNNMWMPVAYSNGERDGTSKDVIDYGVDWSKAKTIEVIFVVDDDDPEHSRDDWDGGFGGAIVLSSQAADNTTHNWNSKDFWGVNEEENPDLEFNTVDDTKAIILETIGDYTYKAVCPIDDTNSVVDNAQLVQIAVQDWSGVTFWAMKVDSMTVKDASGNTLISWDENGQCSLAPLSAAGAVEAAAEPAPAAEDAAPAPAAETAPAAGDTTAATTSSKGSPDTGIADVAAIAGIGIAAAGAVVLSRKRK